MKSPDTSDPVPDNQAAEWIAFVKRADRALVLFAGVTAFLGGIAFALAFLGLNPFDPRAVVLFGLLAVLGALAGFLTLRQRDARLRKEMQAAQQHTAELSARLHADETALAEQRAQIVELEARLRHAANAPSLTLPIVLGWQSLELPEEEIAPPLKILTQLFIGQSHVRIAKKFSGGHRNRGVYLVRGASEAERVVKVARSADIRAEIRAQELINRFSHHNGAQYVRDTQSADDDALGGIVYRLTSLRRTANIATFAELYRETEDWQVLGGVLTQLFTDVLPHAQFRDIEPTALFHDTAFSPRAWTNILRALETIPLLREVTRTQEFVRVDPDATAFVVRNPLDWLERILPRHAALELPIVRGVIHGDLHSENMLIETPALNLWIIDFAETREHAPTLSDFARLETDLKFYLLRGEQEQDFLERARRFEELLLSPGTVSELGTVSSPFDEGAEFRKAAASIAVLRGIAAQHTRGAHDSLRGHFADDSVVPYYFLLLHSALRMLKYEQCSSMQKTFAFFSAGLTCARLDQLLV